jgi:hypothetical protein
MKRIKFIVLLFLVSSISIQAQTLHSQEPIDLLKSIEKLNSSPNEQQMKQVRQAMLQLNNEARLNPEYRKLAGCKTALTISSGLTPLVLDKRLNAMAQEQAEYQASIQKVTHDNSNYGNDMGKRSRVHLDQNDQLPGVGTAEACGGGTLSSYPMSWMKSETHYRPTWNLDKQTVNAVGFGAAKGNDGQWYVTAVWCNLKSPTNENGVKPSINSESNKWFNFRYVKFEIAPGESLKAKEAYFLASSNLKYILHFNADGIPELGEVVEKKRQEEDELVRIKPIYTFSVRKHSWAKTDETKFYIQKKDGNLQFVHVNTSYWGLTNGRDQNVSILYKVAKLKITDDGRIVLLDKASKELWSHK